MEFQFAFAVPPSLKHITLEACKYECQGTTLHGYVAWDATHEQVRPGVLIVPDFFGPQTARVQERAVWIASLGYVALVVDMYGLDHVPATREEASALIAPLLKDRMQTRVRVTAAMNAISARKGVDAGRIAIMGYCFGGTVALELARSGAAIRGAISIHGGLTTPHAEDARNIKGKILALHGSEDPSVTQEHVTAFMEEMRSAGIDWQLVQYGGAKHGFTNPDADKIASPVVAYNADADRRSQIAVRVFLEEILG